MNNIFTARRMALGLGVLIALAFLGPATGRATFFYRDFGVLAYPTAVYHHEMFWRGELPLWNPYSNCGVPFLAQWGTMTLYPFSLIYLVLPLPWSLNLFCLLHLWWGAVGVYRLANRWTASQPAAALAAILFLFNGLTLSTLFWPNYTVAFAWMPWIVLFTERAWLNGGKAIPLAALAGTMQMLSGVPELTLLTWLLSSALAIPDLIRNKETILRLGSVVLMIAGISAVQLLPFFELLSVSHRQAGVGETKWALPLTGLGNFVLPMLHAFMTPQGTWYQHDQHFLSSTYLGMTGVLLAIFGAITGGVRARLLAIAAVLCVTLALGPNLQSLPLVGLARYPVKFTLLLPLIVPLLAAFGIRALEEKKVSAKHFALAAAVSIPLLCLLLYWTHTHPLQFDWWPGTRSNSITRIALFLAASALIYSWLSAQRPGFLLAALILLAFDGRFHLQNQNPTTEIATLKAGLQERGLPKLGEGRVFISPEAEDRLLKSGLTNLNTDFVGKQLAVWSHLNLVELVPKVNGSATLQLREQKEIQDHLYSKTNISGFDRNAWLDFLGVNRITSPASVVEWTNRSAALPLVQVSTNFLEAPADSLPLGEGVVESFQFERNEVRASVNARAPATVVIAQSWHPAWKAEVNGEPVPLRRANRAFQAVIVPAGKSVIRLRYQGPRAGLAISFLALTACCWLLGRKNRVT